MIEISLLYIASSHTVHVYYFSIVLLVVIFFNTLSLIFFSVNVEMSENVAKRNEFV